MSFNKSALVASAPVCVPEHLRLLSPSQQKALLRNDHYKGHSVGSSWSLGLFQNNIMYVGEDIHFATSAVLARCYISLKEN